MSKKKDVLVDYGNPVYVRYGDKGVEYIAFFVLNERGEQIDGGENGMCLIEWDIGRSKEYVPVSSIASRLLDEETIDSKTGLRRLPSRRARVGVNAPSSPPKDSISTAVATAPPNNVTAAKKTPQKEKAKLSRQQYGWWLKIGARIKTFFKRSQNNKKPGWYPGTIADVSFFVEYDDGDMEEYSPETMEQLIKDDSAHILEEDDDEDNPQQQYYCWPNVGSRIEKFFELNDYNPNPGWYAGTINDGTVRINYDDGDKERCSLKTLVERIKNGKFCDLNKEQAELSGEEEKTPKRHVQTGGNDSDGQASAKKQKSRSRVPHEKEEAIRDACEEDDSTLEKDTMEGEPSQQHDDDSLATAKSVHDSEPEESAKKPEDVSQQQDGKNAAAELVEDGTIDDDVVAEEEEGIGGASQEYEDVASKNDVEREEDSSQQDKQKQNLTGADYGEDEGDGGSKTVEEEEETS